MNNFYTREELLEMNFRHIGDNVLISKNANFYSRQKIKIGSNVRIDDFCILSGEISIGNYIHIGAGTTLIAGDAGIELHDYCGLSHRVNIFAVSDDFSGQCMVGPMVPDCFRKVRKGTVVLKKHSVIGCASVILPNVTIEEGVAIGAMSLVLKSTVPWKTYFGIPARIIGDRSKALLEFEKQLPQLK